MKFCGQCGAKVDEGVKFCPSCGAAMEVAEKKAEEPKQTAQNDFTAKLQKLNDTADSTSDLDAADIEQNKIMALLSYLSWLVLIPIFAAPNSRFARYHANQGLVLLITEVVWIIIQSILSTILYAIHLGFISVILGLVNLVFLVLLVIGITNAVSGKAKELPFIGKIRILK